MTQVNLNLSEIYKCLCPECKRKIIDMVKDQLNDTAVRNALEGKEEKASDDKLAS